MPRCTPSNDKAKFERILQEIFFDDDDDESLESEAESGSDIKKSLNVPS